MRADAAKFPWGVQTTDGQARLSSRLRQCLNVTICDALTLSSECRVGDLGFARKLLMVGSTYHSGARLRVRSGVSELSLKRE